VKIGAIRLTILLLIIAMLFNLLAQYFLKSGISGIRFEGFSLSVIAKISMIPSIWFGAIFYGCSFLFYILALSRGELGKISPVSQAFTTLGIVAMSVIVFAEPITTMKIIGVLLLVAGTIIIFL
jgi:multidrug transporter EmrE-like cation transporter